MASLPRTASRVMREWRLVIDQKLAQRAPAAINRHPGGNAGFDLYRQPGRLPVTYINQSGRKLLGIGKNEDISRIRLADFHSPADGQKILSQGMPHAIKRRYVDR